ncbi:MAG: glycosyltransferase family 4 protein [Bryobacteraceae bacterium]
MATWELRILLAHNSLYYPSYGGGDKSNRLLMEALAARGHTVRVVARVELFGKRAHRALIDELAALGVAPEAHGHASLEFELNGVEVRILTGDSNLRPYFAAQMNAFSPEIVVSSTDDPAHLMLEMGLCSPRVRVVYLVRATVALPFGPDSGLHSAFHTDRLRQTDGVVAVSEYVAQYARRWGALDAVHMPISLLDPGVPPRSGRFENRFVSIVNPCAAKGISIFLALAKRFPKVDFAAVPTWGTTAADFAALQSLPNVSLLPPVADINALLCRTKVMLVPSLWAEARSRMILEAMSRGIPVMASNAGGLAEAMLGMDYVLPVNPVTRYRPTMDELMVPAVDIPAQNIEPWAKVLDRLLTDRAHYEHLAAASRGKALEYARTLTVEPFEAYLAQVLRGPARRVVARRPSPRAPLSDERRRLMALRLRRANIHVGR